MTTASEPRRPDFRARVEDYLELAAQGEIDEMIRIRLGRISPRTLERIKAAARQQDEALRGEAA